MPEDIGKTLTRRAREWGAANLRIEQGGKHPRLVGDFGGKSFIFAFPGSTGDWRAEKNCLSDLRRLLGVERKDRVAIRPAKARSRHAKPKPPTMPRSSETIQREDRYYAPLALLRDAMTHDRDDRCPTDAEGCRVIKLRTPFLGPRPRFLKA